jgi:CubicO group peptidase (beta-lactamase class C family)
MGWGKRARLLSVLAVVVLSAGGELWAQKEPIEAALQPFVSSNWLAGAVTVVVGQKGVISRDEVGYADLADKKEMEEDTLFWIASMTKPITAVAFMMLVDEGKVSLDDPVAKYIPQMDHLWVAETKKGEATVTLKPQARPITLRHLLSHTSGLPFLTPLQKVDLSSLSVEDAILTFTMNPLEFQPGEGYRYSNEGIDTAGRVIEIVSGMPYEKFLQTRLFDPLGMKDTTFFPTSRQLKRLAKSYAPNAEKNGLKEVPIAYFKKPYDRSGRYPEPGGGLFSTGEDLARFCEMLLNGGLYKGKRYLTEAALAEMSKKQTGASDQKYGLGLAIDQDGHGAFGHGGAQATNMTIYPDKKLALIWLVQHCGYAGRGGDAQGAFKNAAFALAPAAEK